MGIFDSDGFGKDSTIEGIKLSNKKEVFNENSFDSSIIDNINPLVKMDVINSRYNMGKLLEDLGYHIHGSNMYCPFHPDEATGNPSAKYHADSDKVYCFSENKMYSAYHVIKLLYGIDIDKVFKDIWYTMSVDERHNVMDKYDESAKDVVVVPSTWDKYNKLVLSKFKDKSVSFKQYKNALYKVLDIIREEQEGIK